jgi:hypothetical protein
MGGREKERRGINHKKLKKRKRVFMAESAEWEAGRGSSTDFTDWHGLKEKRASLQTVTHL